MNKEEALEVLGNELKAAEHYFDHSCRFPKAAIEQILAALSSCACGEPIEEGEAINCGVYFQGLNIVPHLKFLLYEDEATYTEESRTRWAREWKWKPLGRVGIFALPTEETAHKEGT